MWSRSHVLLCLLLPVLLLSLPLAAAAETKSLWPSLGDALHAIGLGGLWPWPRKDPTETEKAAVTGEGENWAVLVAGSNGWFNYRHQADIAHAYRILKQNGYPEENIITLMYDDIAEDPRNPYPGSIINQPNGDDVYAGINIDYRGADVNPNVFMSVLIGQDPGVGSRKVLRSGPKDNVFINFADHGGAGLIAFPLGKILTSKQLVDTLQEMHERRLYGKLVFYMEACESGSMFENLLPPNINIFATTASTASQSSFATYWDLERKTFLGDLYSVSWMEDSDCHFFGPCKGQKETLQNQFNNVYNRTKASSQPQEYGDKKFAAGALIEEFQAYTDHVKTVKAVDPTERTFLTSVLRGRREANIAAQDAVDSRHVTIEALKRSLTSAANSADTDEIQAQLEAEYRGLQHARDRFAYLAATVAGQNGLTYLDIPVSNIRDHTCLSDSLLAFVEYCHVMDDHHIRHAKVLAHLCNKGFSSQSIIQAIKSSPACMINS